MTDVRTKNETEKYTRYGKRNEKEEEEEKEEEKEEEEGEHDKKKAGQISKEKIYTSIEIREGENDEQLGLPTLGIVFANDTNMRRRMKP